MPRIRTLKPEIWSDEALGACPRDARLLFVGLITQADDEGRFRAAPALLRASIFPYDESLTRDRVQAWLDALAEAGLVILYTVKGQRYGQFPAWTSHQKIDRPSESKLPPIGAADPAPTTETAGLLDADRGANAGDALPADVADATTQPNGPRKPASLNDSANTRRTLGEPSTLEGKGREGKGKDQGVIFDTIYQQWNTQPGLIHHRRPTPAMRRATANALNDHDPDDILQAISLYSTVLTSTKHWFTYSWTLEEFLKRGLAKFTPEVGPLTRYYGAGPNGNGNHEAPDRDPVAAHQRDVEKCRRDYHAFIAGSRLSEDEARVEVLGMYRDEVVDEAIPKARKGAAA